MGDNILRLTVVAGRNLPSPRQGQPGGELVCVARVVVGESAAKLKKKRTTSSTRWTPNPVWGGEMLTFEVDAHLAGLKVECWAKEKSGKTSLGEVIVPRASLPLNCEAESWYTLAPGKDTKPSNLRTSASPAELYLRLNYQSVPTASPLKDRMKLRRRSSSLLRRQKRKELERIFPLSPDEELLRTKKCYMSKEKGRLYVTNLHVGFYEKKKAGVWLEYPHILHISVEGSDLFITDHNTNEYCFHEGAKIYKVIYALWRGGSAVEELATTEDSDSLGSDPSSPGPDPIPYPRSVSDPHPPSISEGSSSPQGASPPVTTKHKKFSSTRYRAFKGELSSLRTLSNSDGCLQSKIAPEEPSAAPGRVRKRLSTGLRHFLRPAEVDKNNKQLHQQMSDSQGSPVAVADLDKNNNASGSIHGSGSGHNRDRIVLMMEEDDDQTEAVDEKTMIEQAASHASSSNDGLNTCLYASSDRPPRSDLYRPRADTWAAPARRYGGNDDDGVDDETSDEGDRRADGARSDEGDGDDEDEDGDEEKEGEEDMVSLSSGDSDPRSLSSIAVSIALGARDDIATEQLMHSSTATTRTTSMDEESDEGKEARRRGADGDAAGAAAATAPARRSQSLIVPKRRCSNAGISTKGDQGTSQIRLLIKPSKSDPNTLVVKVISALNLDIPRGCVCESVFVQVQYARQTEKTEAVNGSSSSLFFNQKIKFNWIGGKSEFIDVTCWYIDPKRGRDVFVGQAVVPLPSPVHGVRSYRIDGWYELVDRRVKAVSQIRRRIGGVVRLPDASPRALHATPSDDPSESGSVVVRTRALKRSGPDLHGSVVIHATGSADPVGASAADDDEPTVLEQPFTDTVESYSFDDCEDTFELERSLSPRTDDDWTSRAATPRERSSAEAASSLRRSQQQSMTPLASSTNTTTSLAPPSTTPLASSSSSSSSASPPTPSYLYLMVVFAVLLVGALFEIARRDL